MSQPSGGMSEDEETIAAVQRYLETPARGTAVDPAIRALLERAVRRLETLCANMVYRGCPPGMRPALELQPDEKIGAMVERLLEPIQTVRPRSVREFFARANEQMRGQFHDLASRLNEKAAAVKPRDRRGLTPAIRYSALSPEGRCMLEAIDHLPEVERETFGLMRVQGLSQAEAAEVLDLAVKTVQRRLNRSVLLLAEELDGFS